MSSINSLVIFEDDGRVLSTCFRRIVGRVDVVQSKGAGAIDLNYCRLIRGVRLLTTFRLASALATDVCRCRHRLKEAGPCEGSRNPAPRLQPASLRGQDRRRLRDRRDHACDPDERTPIPRRGSWQPRPADKVALARVGMKRDLGRYCATNAENCGPESAV